jgi:hypothetical protein
MVVLVLCSNDFYDIDVRSLFDIKNTGEGVESYPMILASTPPNFAILFKFCMPMGALH